MPRLESFFARYPDIKIDITLNDRVVDLIEEGVDIAFRMGNLRDSNLIARKLCTSPTAAAASPEYLKKYGVPRHPRDLKEHNYVVYTDLSNPDQTSFREFGNPLHIKVSGNLQTNNSEVLRSALLHGLGIAQVPRWLIGDKVAEGELVEVLTEYQSAPSSVHAVYSPGLHVPSKLRCFIDYFADEFKNCNVINGPDAKAA